MSQKFLLWTFSKERVIQIVVSPISFLELLKFFLYYFAYIYVSAALKKSNCDNKLTTVLAIENSEEFTKQ